MNTFRSHLVTVPPGPLLSEALMSSPVVVGEDGSGAPPAGMAGFEFGIDPNEDPELALVTETFPCIMNFFVVLCCITMKIVFFFNYSRPLRVSMEEQRARQEDEARKVAEQSAEEAGVKPVAEGIIF